MRLWSLLPDGASLGQFSKRRYFPRRRAGPGLEPGPVLRWNRHDAAIEQVGLGGFESTPPHEVTEIGTGLLGRGLQQGTFAGTDANTQNGGGSCWHEDISLGLYDNSIQDHKRHSLTMSSTLENRGAVDAFGENLLHPNTPDFNHEHPPPAPARSRRRGPRRDLVVGRAPSKGLAQRVRVPAGPLAARGST